MAGGLTRYRHLSRSSAHRQALLRNLVTSLVMHEQIHTTYAKAKEAQRVAEKLITLAKRNTETSLRKVQGILYTPHEHLGKVFNELRVRYASRPGGYTRVLRTMPKDTYSQGDSAILELVDGPKDMKFALTAAAVAREKSLNIATRPITMLNMKKVTRFRPDGKQAFENMVKRMEGLDLQTKHVDNKPVPLRLVGLKKKKGKQGYQLDQKKAVKTRYDALKDQST